MIFFFERTPEKLYLVQSESLINPEDQKKLEWLFGNARLLDEKVLKGDFIGPRANMITPWSTNAVEITQNMLIAGIQRIESFEKMNDDNANFDPMLSQKFHELNQEVFDVNISPEPIQYIEDIAAYNDQEGLSLSSDEVSYLEDLAARLDRKLSDSEVFGFSQVNSEHCRHKIFNGTFVIDGEEMPSSLFKLIKKTAKENPNEIVSAYKDNVAFVNGPTINQFAPAKPNEPSFYELKPFESVLSVKAETHNFPTTVEPFNGAATGSGGEIRDRLAGGKGSIPLAGTAVYMTAYSRLNDERPWEKAMPERKWLYQSPIEILIKASNGASDFGNKFGQPLIAGSVFTFEHEENGIAQAYDKVIMQAGGIGYGKKSQALKDTPKKGDQIVILGGDNYRIGMGGAAVSSADTGAFESGIELNAVQRSNPEMQKRAANTIRALVEANENPIVSIHDHGAGGHLNCLSELVEETGGEITIEHLPIGDKTLSFKEIIGNESQERMGLVIGEKDLGLLKEIADRERSPMYNVGVVTGDDHFTFKSDKTGEKPMDLELSDMFGSSPKTIMNDRKLDRKYEEITYDKDKIHDYLSQVLKLEAVACKDWLTNKVDRCVGGKVAKQQCVGPLQLPLNNVGVMALDFEGKEGLATSIGHAPVQTLIDAEKGAQTAILESLSNLVWAPLEKGVKSISLSANWMWPCRNEGEDARLYEAVKAVSDYAIDLGINIPTGKDSLSMAQKYPGKTITAPGTVIISAAGQCSDINRIVEPLLKISDAAIYYLPLAGMDFELGGSSLGQVLNKIGTQIPNIVSGQQLANIFDTIQEAIKSDLILAGHDVSSGGLITTLLEMCFSTNKVGASIDLWSLEADDMVKALFSEQPALVIQAEKGFEKLLQKENILFYNIGQCIKSQNVTVNNLTFDIAKYRDEWYETSYLLDQNQTAGNLAKARIDNYKEQALNYTFPSGFTGSIPSHKNIDQKPIAAILREKGSNSEREMANALFQAGFQVRDVHMTDLITGRETLEDVQFLGAVGGFSNSDVLGSAKGWAGAFLYNPKAKKALENFFKREDTLSVGICNGCQLFLELDLINPEHTQLAKMDYNDSRKHESAFTSVTIQKNKSVMLSNLEGCTLGVWISHGEGKFNLPMNEADYDIVAKYGYDAYPSNPNGSAYNTAMICSADGRHLATMPHIERSFYPWNWAYYDDNRNDEVSPWALAFVNAYEYIKENA
ncbi:phosphoribosylformylglycinamidine synthase [Portibacter lacus]|uniref:Phosphoribosylformylglycinamidine synthase n=1 Tax=Portibacter lacus TaxID=1099794 RepID=A0AA37SMC9_9BACT|nr:phosphoribosylformylglycinamidine synthase [Portibacter lacus]GLR17041.1 phosphoribosylformylglycinamidine synthase [Portibacter lacus]